jgi:hypothetical protein
VTGRLATNVIVSALLRKTSAAGGFAAVLAKGDAVAGAILLVAAEKGRISGLWERILSSSDSYDWTRVGPQDVDIEQELSHYIARRCKNDPDLWVVELDIPDAAQFAAQLTAET